MNSSEIIRIRMQNQQITGTKFKKPAELISWLGGIQAQDYEAAKWGIGLRLPGLTEADVEKAVAGKEIVRTWPMRGTLHIVAAEDARWLLELMAPRLTAGNKGRERELELDEALFTQSLNILERALEGGKQLTREELTEEFTRAGIDMKGVRLYHVLQRAGLERLICFGVRRGKEFTFTLLDEWIKPSKPKARYQAQAEMARRYFRSRGPATLEDFIWWTSLPAVDARAGLEAVKPILESIIIEGRTYWFADNPGYKSGEKEVYLLPAFDEYLLGYRDRGLIFDSKEKEKLIQKNGIFSPVVLINGRAYGTWKRSFKKDKVFIETSLFITAGKAVIEAMMEETRRYAGFMNKELG